MAVCRIVPTDDLYNIFQKYYGREVIAKDLLEGCIAEMHAVRELERLAGTIIYPLFTQSSSIFQDELEVALVLPPTIKEVLRHFFWL